MKTHKDLESWKGSLNLVVEIYQITEHYPKVEQFGLASQMRRAAVSIPSNISEGAARRNVKEFMHYLYVALGSLSELETQSLISERLNYLSSEKCQSINQQVKTIMLQIRGLIRSLERKCS